MKSLSIYLKETILAAILNNKKTMPAIAVRFFVSHKMVQKIKFQHQDIGTLQRQNQKTGGSEYSLKDSVSVLARRFLKNQAWR